jgi:hypothetical protein
MPRERITLGASRDGGATVMALSDRTKILLSACVIVGAAGGGTAVGLAAGSRPVSAPMPYSQPAGHATLSCETIPASSTTGQTIGDDIGLLAADNTAIGGNWAQAVAEATGTLGGTASPTAAQHQAVNDLTRALTDFSSAVEIRGQLASDVSTFYYAASHLTNGTPGWQLQDPVVESDLLTLAAECQAP